MLQYLDIQRIHSFGRMPASLWVVFKVQCTDLLAPHFLPPVRCHVVHAHAPTARRIPERRMVDSPLPQLDRILDTQVPLVTLILSNEQSA